MMSELQLALTRALNLFCDIAEGKLADIGAGEKVAPVQSDEKPQWVMPETKAPTKLKDATKPAAKPGPVAPPHVPQEVQSQFDPMAEVLDDSDATSAVLTIEEVKAEIDRCYSLKKDEVSRKAFGADFIAAIKKFKTKNLKEVPADKYAELLAIVASL